MDVAIPATDSLFRWPTEVLRGLGLIWSDLAIAASSEQRLSWTDETVYVPVQVQQAGTGSHSLRVILVWEADITSIRATLSPLTSSSKAISGQVARSIFAAGEPLVVSFGDVPAGVFLLNVLVSGSAGVDDVSALVRAF
jgi:hypothetical protein